MTLMPKKLRAYVVMVSSQGTDTGCQLVLVFNVRLVGNQVLQAPNNREEPKPVGAFYPDGALC